MRAPDLLDAPTTALLRVSAAVADGSEAEVAEALTAALRAEVPPAWVEELLLQSILMVGYPRALVALAVWRGVSGRPAPADDPDADYTQVAEWERRGAATCFTVYGGNYDKLRRNVRALHPAAERWMLVEGYGRTLSRPGLDLMRRELCTVVQTAVLGTPRQLHSHLRGALHAGASVGQVEEALTLVEERLDPGARAEVLDVWLVVRAAWTEAG